MNNKNRCVEDVARDMKTLDIIKQVILINEIDHYETKIMTTPVIKKPSPVFNGRFEVNRISNKFRIYLHPLLWDHPIDMEDTFMHEIAHSIQFLRYGPKAEEHGIEWQNIMCELKRKPIPAGNHTKDYHLAMSCFILADKAKKDEENKDYYDLIREFCIQAKKLSQKSK